MRCVAVPRVAETQRNASGVDAPLVLKMALRLIDILIMTL